MAAATSAPPDTASEPPSQKSFCTSTMINALLIAAPPQTDPDEREATPAEQETSARASVVQELRRNRRVATRKLEGARRQFRQRPLVAGAGLGQRLAADDLPAAYEGAQQRPVVRTRGRLAGRDDLGDGLAVLAQVPYPPFAPTAARLADRALGHRPQRALRRLRARHQLVDQRRRRCARSGDQRRTAAVPIPRRGGQPGDGVLIQVPGHDDPRLGGAQRVELRPYLV